MKWMIEFYNERVEKETLSLPVGIKSNLIYILELIEEFGPNLGRPHTAPIRSGLFEIRAKGKEGIARSFFCSIERETIVILHSIINKKSTKAPQKDIDLAFKRMKEVKNG